MAGSEAGPNLRNARRRLRLSQSAAAGFIGTTRQSLAAFERGIRQPDLKQLVGLCNLYRLTPDELIGGARSAVRTDETPSFHARRNTAKDVTDLDREELTAFKAYLRQRRRSAQRPHFKRTPLEPVGHVVVKLTKDAEVESVAPVPIFALLARYGVEVRFTALGELAGALLLADDDEHPDGVLINSDQPYDRQRFSAAHELGHLVLGHERPASGRFESYLGRRFDTTEVHADQFASELLVPEKLLREKVRELPPNDGLPESVYRLASMFLVSFQAMSTRLAKLGALDPDDQNLLAKVKPGELGKKLELGKGEVGKKFRVQWLPTIARESLSSDWHRRADPDTVRLLQESAYSYYLGKVPEGEASDSPGGVYEKVGLWVASEYPIVASTRS